MRKNIWVIGDTHFHHTNILNFKDKEGNYTRPFSTVEDMDEFILTKWNETVKEGDIVYHLGDVFIGPKDKFKSFWPKLKGSKRLIVGNHDDIKFLSSGGFFKKVSLWRMWKDEKIVMSHIPLNKTQCQRYISEKETRYLLNVHGHTHQNNMKENNYFNVSCENINYTPIHIEDLALIAKGLN